MTDLFDFFDLVLRYGEQRQEQGMALQRGSAPAAYNAKIAARDLFNQFKGELIKERRKARAGFEQVRNVHGLRWWIHTCGATWPQSMSPNPDECLACPDKPSPWRPLLVAADTPQPDGPVVLTLPEVPEGAWLRGVDSGRRWTRQASNWRCEDFAPVRVVHLGAVLVIEGPNGVTVEMAPPRKPRTWPRLEVENDDLPHVVEVANSGHWARLPAPDGHLYALKGDRYGLRLSLGGLRTIGDVTEVFDA